MARRKKRALKAGDVFIANGRPLVRETEGRYDPKNWQSDVSVAPTLSRFFACTYGSKREIEAAAKRSSPRARRKHDVIVVARVKHAMPGQNWALCRRVRG